MTTTCCSPSMAGECARGWSSRATSTPTATTSSRSAGELSVAKEQNVAFRSGWFSERSATYLASGRPVVMQDTGFGAALPTGEGLLAFSELGDAAEALAAVQADPARHRRAARELAREFLSHEVVLGDLLDHLGLPVPERAGAPGSSPAPAQLPAELSLEVVSRRPLELVEETIEHAARPARARGEAAGEAPVASVVVPVVDNLACTRLSLESVLANTDGPAYEIVVVDNGSERRRATTSRCSRPATAMCA